MTEQLKRRLGLAERRFCNTLRVMTAALGEPGDEIFIAAEPPFYSQFVGENRKRLRLITITVNKMRLASYSSRARKRIAASCERRYDIRRWLMRLASTACSWHYCSPFTDGFVVANSTLFVVPADDQNNPDPGALRILLLNATNWFVSWRA